MTHPNNKTLPERIQPWLTLLASFGLSAGSAATVIAVLWQSAKGELEVNKRLLLVLISCTTSFFVLGVWWVLKQRKSLASLRSDVADARKRPHRFQDECTPDEKLGMYRHTTKPGFFCVPCAAGKDLETPMQTRKDGWICPIESKHFVRNPDYQEPPPPPRSWPIGPSDPGFFPE